MSERDDELTPELRALLRRGITPLEAPEGAAGRLSARLATTLAEDPTVGGGEDDGKGEPLGWTRATAAQWLVVAALGGAVAGSALAVAALTPSLGPVIAPSAPVAATPGSLAPPPAPLADAAARLVPGMEPMEASAEGAGAAAAPAPKIGASADVIHRDTAGKERELLDRARAAFGRGDLDDAYRTLNTHGARYPKGVLAEEREALAVRTLAGLGRSDEARARARRFEATYPDSVMLPVVRETTAPRNPGTTDANL
jgi:hypothetical protein